MANSSLKFLLGLYPKTEDIEKKQSELIKEYDELNLYAKSEELARFEYLDKFVNSPNFTERRNFYKNLTFQNSDDKKKEDEYLRQKKSNEIKFYYKFKSSEGLAKFLQLDGSKEISHFENLKTFIESAEFKKVEEYMNDKKKWEKTEEFRKTNEFADLEKNQAFRNYFKFIGTKEYKDYEKYVGSTEIAMYESREKYLQTQEFLSVKPSMKKKEYKLTEAHQKFEEFRKWKKDRAFQHYFKLLHSSQLADYRKIHESKELVHYRELETFIKNPQLKIKEKEIKALRFENTDEYKRLQEYKKLASSRAIKDYYKMRASQQLADYRKLDASKLIPDYESLEKYILSDEFKKNKLYLLDKHKWEKSDEYKQYQEYLLLKKNPKISWYYKLKDSPKYNTLKTWRMAFSDDFAAGKLDRNKWLTRYFWGEVLLNDTYALPGEKHLFTDAKNIEMNGSTMKIITKNEKITGKEWNPVFGFFPKEFDYTSGIVCSGISFRTKYGRIEAKVKLEAAQGVVHAFWLAGDTLVPQIDVFKFYNNKLIFSSFWGNPTEKNGIKNDTASISGSKFAGKYMIYSIEWSPEKISWKINGLEVKTQTNNIPQEEMYLSLNSGVLGDTAGPLPSSMEVDWVKVYQKN